MSVIVTFLGTASGKPSPQRSVSCVTLFREGDLFVFDCGEGSQIQLAKAPMRPGSIRAIFLTHFHGDHVNGLPGLIGSLTLNQREEALTIVGPVGLRKWFRTLHELGILRPGFEVNLVEIEEEGIVYRGEGFHVETKRLQHRIECWGYALVEDPRPGRFDLQRALELGVPRGPDFGRLQKGQSVCLKDGVVVTPDQVLGPARPGLRISYCCDTSPCQAAVELSRQADLIIHESTYPAGEEKLARSRAHSTSADAARCARDADAKRLVLTHFSQKYVRPEIFLKGAKEIFPRVEAARDLMEVVVEREEA